VILNLKANCKINEIKSKHKKYFSPDTLDQAHGEGFDNCAHCIGGKDKLSQYTPDM